VLRGQRAARDFVCADRPSVVFRLLDELDSLGADGGIRRGEAAVAKLRLGLHIHVDGCNSQRVLRQKPLHLVRVAEDLIGEHPLDAGDAFDLRGHLQPLGHRLRRIVFVKPIFRRAEETRNHRMSWQRFHCPGASFVFGFP